MGREDHECFGGKHLAYSLISIDCIPEGHLVPNINNHRLQSQLCTPASALYSKNVNQKRKIFTESFVYALTN